MINNIIDLRSDTVTVPTPAMREAMATAEVGDDVMHEDPTVNKLQDMAAAMLGKEAGLLVTSGTQGNLVAIMAHCDRGHEVIMGDRSHIYTSEQGGSAVLASIFPRVLQNQPDGTLRIEDIERAIQGDNEHFAISRLVALENTQNQCNGAVLTPAYVKQVADLAHSRGLLLHIDGARLFNAAAALPGDVRANARALVEHADSATFCLSKGLSAPVGSVLVGSRAFWKKAHRARKALGGAMRQAGVFAAAGVVALEQMLDRLRDDAANARRFAEGIGTIPGISVNLDQIKTNIVYFDLDPKLGIDGPELARRTAPHRVKLGGGAYRLRAVTHAWVNAAEVDEAVAVVKQCLVSS
jgi:threonine aldolase